ncbi:sulfotransferase family protein [Paraglaciecola aestuariivivens]
MKALLKAKAIKIFSKFISQDEIQKRLEDKIQCASQTLPDLNNLKSPYSTAGFSQATSTSERDDIVFITSRFRSGSTLLWNLFRQTNDCTSYYEPFNERQWFNPNLRGNTVDNTHRGVDDYSAEYDGLEFLESLYNESWINKNLLMTQASWAPNMKAYIEKLIEHAKGRPVLQFNRIDFRLPWIKTHFPNAKIIHLYRHPRDQWCSFLTDKKLMNKNDVAQTYRDAFYLDVWCNDLAQQYPVLDKRHTPHPYQRFYYLWKLSYLHGVKYSDHNLSFEQLTQKPKEEISNLYNLLDLPKEQIESLCSVIQPPQTDQWKQYADENWFSVLEAECEKNLTIYLNNLFASKSVN